MRIYSRIVLQIVLTLFLAALLAGCRLDLSTHIDVAGDGSGTLALSITTDAELDAAASAAGVDPLGRMVERINALDSDWRVGEAGNAGDDTRVVTLSTGFGDSAEFAARYRELSAALDAPEAQLLGPLTLDVDDETGITTVAGTLPLMVSDVAAADLGTDVAGLSAQLDGVVTNELTIRTPGRVLSADGVTGITTEGSGAVSVTGPLPEEPATLSWLVDRVGGQAAVATTFEPGGSDLVRILLLAGLAVLAVAIIGAGIYAGRRR